MLSSSENHFFWLVWANSHHSFNSGHQPNIVKGESWVYRISSHFTSFVPLGTRADLCQIITCLFYLPASSISVSYTIFFRCFFLRRAEIGRKRDKNTSLPSCERTYCHLCMRSSAKSHFYLVSKEICVGSLSVSSVEGSTAATVRKLKRYHAGEWNAEVGGWWCGAWCDLDSDFYHQRKIAINEEASLLRRWESSSIEHQGVS